MRINYRLIGLMAFSVFIFQVYGYPIVASIPLLLQVSSTPINASFRALFSVLSLLLIFATLCRSSPLRFDRGFYWFLSFWCIYSLRLIYDLEVMEIKYMNETKEWVYLFAFGGCFLPSVALFFAGRYINLHKMLKNIYLILLLSNAFIFFDVLYLSNGNLSDLFLQRVILEVENNKTEASSVINPITISLAGEILALFSIAILLIDEKSISLKKIIVYPALLLGIINLFLGASRGPVLGFLLFLIFLFYLRIKLRPLTSKLILRTTFFILLSTIFIIFYLIPQLDNLDMELINRTLVSLGRKEDIHYRGEERTTEYASAINQFMRSPIWGDKFVDDVLRSYPHNFILEVLMATGLLGFIPFTMLFYQLAKKISVIYRSIKEYPWMVFYLLIILTTLFSFFLSGGLFVGVVFWNAIALILSIKTSMITFSP
jgi:O-antigen ligase